MVEPLRNGRLFFLRYKKLTKNNTAKKSVFYSGITFDFRLTLQLIFLAVQNYEQIK